jgi:hypothetical protein
MAASLSACGAPTGVVMPTPTPTPAPASTPTPAPPAFGWTITIRTTGVAGPAFCIYTPPVGSVFTTTYGLDLRGDFVVFVPPDPIDWESYTATLDGLNFTAVNPPVGSGAGMCAHYMQASSLSGSFSPDRSSFTATEIWSFTLDSGEVKTVTFLWNGVRN